MNEIQDLHSILPVNDNNITSTTEGASEANFNQNHNHIDYSDNFTRIKNFHDETIMYLPDSFKKFSIC